MRKLHDHNVLRPPHQETVTPSKYSTSATAPSSGRAFLGDYHDIRIGGFKPRPRLAGLKADVKTGKIGRS